MSKKANFYIQENDADLQDDLFQLGQSNHIEFHQVANVKTYDDDYSDTDGYIVAVYMRSDKVFDSYSRQVTDILVLLGDLGGLQEFFIMVGSLMVGFVT